MSGAAAKMNITQWLPCTQLQPGSYICAQAAFYGIQVTQILNMVTQSLYTCLLQALKELALDYENNNANVPVPIMYDDETAYLCDQGSA